MVLVRVLLKGFRRDRVRVLYTGSMYLCSKPLGPGLEGVPSIWVLQVQHLFSMGTHGYMV